MGIKQPFFSASSHTSVSSSTFRTDVFHARTEWSSVIGLSPQPIDTPGTLRNWKILLGTAPGSGLTRTYTIWKNGSSTSLSVAISGTNTTASNVATDLTVAAGDTVYVEMVPSGGSPPTTSVKWVIEFETSDVFTSMHVFGGVAAGSLQTSTTPIYDGILNGGDWNTVAGQGRSVAAISGTITSYRVRHTAPGVGRSRTFVIEKNGVAQDGTGGTPDTTIVVSDTANNGTASFSLPITALNTVRVKEVAAGTPTNTAAQGSVTFVSDVAGHMAWAMSSDDAPTANSTEYQFPLGRTGALFVTTESSREFSGPITPITLKGLYVLLLVAPGSGISHTYTLRKNQTDTAQSVTISGTNTTAGPSGGAEVEIGTSDVFALKSVVSGLSGSTSRPQMAYLMIDPVAAQTGDFNALLVAP